MGTPDQLESLLEMDPEEFFSVRRLLALGVSHNVAVRVSRCTGEMKFNDPRSTNRLYELSLNTMRDFLARYPNRYPFTRKIDMGEKSVNAAVLAINSENLPFEN